MKKKDEVPVLYLFVYKNLIDKFGKYDRLVSRKAILEVWRRCIHNVPRKFDFYVLQEMCEYGLMERINPQEFQLFGLNADGKLSANEKLKVLDSLTASELRVLDRLAPKHYKLICDGAEVKLKKLNEFFLW